jgi:hypothetical protein
MKISIQTLRDLVAKQVQEKLIQDDCSGNVWHNADGTWGSKKTATSFSHGDKKCDDSGQYKVIGGKKSTNNEKCGRANRKKLCKEEDETELYKSEKIELIIRNTIKQELSKLRQTNKNDTGGCSWQQLLNAMNKVDRARDGKLYAKTEK